MKFRCATLSCHAGNTPQPRGTARAPIACAMETSNYQVLLGDADGENTEFFNRALACCPAFELCHRASSITELISYLAGTGNFVRRTDFCGPDVVLLDLDL